MSTLFTGNWIIPRRISLDNWSILLRKRAQVDATRSLWRLPLCGNISVFKLHRKTSISVPRWIRKSLEASRPIFLKKAALSWNDVNNSVLGVHLPLLLDEPGENYYLHPVTPVLASISSSLTFPKTEVECLVAKLRGDRPVMLEWTNTICSPRPLHWRNIVPFDSLLKSVLNSYRNILTSTHSFSEKN